MAAPRPPAVPVLHLSADRLRRALADLVASARPTGGVEGYVTALHLKSALFAEVLADGGRAMTETEFLDLCAFMAPVRRRIGAVLADAGFASVQARIVTLVQEGPLDARMARFIASFPPGKALRWVRDLAAEILHFTRPEALPLMARWVWDARVGTGVLREIWHAEDVDRARIDVPDNLLTFTTLRGELDGFLQAEGIFRDRHFHVDLLLGHIYAGYINDRGGQYLRNDFTHEGDPMLHTRRMLGLDGVNTETGRTRLRLIDGRAHEFGGGPDARQSLRDAHAHS